MAYSIDSSGEFVEVRLWGETSKLEVLAIIRELDRCDPGKSRHDLWVIAGESQLPFRQYREVAEAVGHLLPAQVAGRRTAIVAGDEFHRAQLAMYPAEAAFLPLEIRVFRSRDEAVDWLRT